jgi:hypothetical protein
MHRSNARAQARRRVRPSSVAWLLAATLAAPLAAPIVARAQDVPDTNAKIRYKGLTLTPIGYFAAEAVFRSHNETADIGSNFNNIPFSHTTNYNLTEFRGTARQSRIGLAVEGKPSKDLKLNGFWESDFLTVGTTSNSNESNSYALRIRQFWGGATLASGTSFYAGQMWSLMTPAKTGVAPRGEAVPVIIDAQYNVGFDWARQWGLRLAQNFNNKAFFAIGLEESQMTFGGHGVPSQVFIGNTGGSQLNSTANYSTDLTPDVVAKLAIEPGFGHWEVKAIGRTFRDRIVDTTGALGGSRTVVRTAGGVGVGVWWPFMYEGRDVLDFGVSGMWGNGIGRYGSSQLIDATTRADGTIVPVRAAHALVTIEMHPTKQLDIFAYGGTEYEYRMATYNSKGAATGYGAPEFKNINCEHEYQPTGPFAGGAPPTGTCTGDTRDLWEGTLGFWYSFYRGSAGRFAWGAEYHYISKNTWVGVGGQPQAIDPMFFTSFRYYLP